MMESQYLHIKNMVCPRCEMVVRQSLQQLGVKIVSLELGLAEIESVGAIKLNQIELEFNTLGFALLRNADNQLIELIKVYCREYLGNLENQLLITKLSDYLKVNVGKNYSYLSKLFSSKEGVTIESYFIQLKIDRVKQLLSYGELSLSEIAVQLNYSSVHYLSSQFKKINGCTVSDYLNSQLQA